MKIRVKDLKRLISEAFLGRDEHPSGHFSHPEDFVKQKPPVGPIGTKDPEDALQQFTSSNSKHVSVTDTDTGSTVYVNVVKENHGITLSFGPSYRISMDEDDAKSLSRMLEAQLTNGNY